MNFEKRSSVKHDFSCLYNCSDPRPYFSTLRPLDFRIHRYAIPVFDRCIAMLRRLRNTPRIDIADLCTGYGVNAALLCHAVSLDHLYELYDESASQVSTDQGAIIDRDRRYFASRRRKGSSIRSFVGIDSAARAIRYAKDTGLLDEGFCTNLEREDASPALRNRVKKISMITLTGGMGYIGPNTLEKILDVSDRRSRPWIVAFPLVTTSLGPFERLFENFGLRTEIWKWESFPQRRFADDEELRRAIISARKTGLPEPSPGAYLQTRLVCARPHAEADAVPLEKIVNAPKRAVSHGTLQISALT